MMSRRSWLMLAFGAVAGGVGYLLFGSGEEARVVETLREVLHAAELRPGEPAAARKARIAASFGEHLESDVRLEVPELPQAANGRAALEVLALDLAESHVSVRFKIEQTEIRSSKSGADVTASITLFAADRESELRDTRHVTLGLERHDGGFRIRSITIGPRSREEPEARP